VDKEQKRREEKVKFAEKVAKGEIMAFT